MRRASTVEKVQQPVINLGKYYSAASENSENFNFPPLYILCTPYHNSYDAAARPTAKMITSVAILVNQIKSSRYHVRGCLQFV